MPPIKGRCRDPARWKWILYLSSACIWSTHGKWMPPIKGRCRDPARWRWILYLCSACIWSTGKSGRWCRRHAQTPKWEGRANIQWSQFILFIGRTEDVGSSLHAFFHIWWNSLPLLFQLMHVHHAIHVRFLFGRASQQGSARSFTTLTFTCKAASGVHQKEDSRLFDISIEQHGCMNSSDYPSPCCSDFCVCSILFTPLRGRVRPHQGRKHR